MEPLDYQELSVAIKEVYLDSEKYQLNKHVPTFQKDGEYVGDFFNFTMFELDGENAPIFYHIFSPYDIITSKSSQHAVVLRAGELIMETEFSPFMIQRTGIMTSIVIDALNVDGNSSNILYVGTGRMAKADLTAMKSAFSKIEQVTFINASGNGKEFVEFAEKLGITAVHGGLSDIGSFDVIACHTNSKEPVLAPEMISQLKEGALITTFSSEDFTEVDSEFFNSDSANIIVDWEQTIGESPELKLAVERGGVNEDKILTLKNILEDRKLEDKKYTIYRSHGTPTQNLAAMKLLMKQGL